MLSIFLLFLYKRQKATSLASIDLSSFSDLRAWRHHANQSAEGDGAADQSDLSLPPESIVHPGVALRTSVEGHMNLVLDDAEELLLKKNVRKKIGRILLKGDNISLIQQIQSTGSNVVVFERHVCVCVNVLLSVYMQTRRINRVDHCCYRLPFTARATLADESNQREFFLVGNVDKRERAVEGTDARRVSNTSVRSRVVGLRTHFFLILFLGTVE